eukprot:g47535.t1
MDTQKNWVRRCLSHAQHQEDTACTDTLITLPYIRNTSELTTRLLRPLGIRVAHKATSTLRQPLSRTKDPLPTIGRTNVMYKIPCRDCDKHYVGQTGRKFLKKGPDLKHQLSSDVAWPAVFLQLYTSIHTLIPDPNISHVLLLGENRYKVLIQDLPHFLWLY